MNIYCIKYLMFTKNNKIKSKIDGISNLHSPCIDCGFKRVEFIDEEELSYLSESSIYL